MLVEVLIDDFIGRKVGLVRGNYLGKGGCHDVLFSEFGVLSNSNE